MLKSLGLLKSDPKKLYSTFFTSVPPKWIREPEDVHAVLGQDVVLSCQVEGYPKPTLLWTRANGK